jgi:glycosyltransferase involved in cell wall biosynthesis
MGVFLFSSVAFESAVQSQSERMRYDKALILGDVCLIKYAAHLNVEELTLDMCDDLAGNYERRSRSSRRWVMRLYYRLQALVIRRLLRRSGARFRTVLAVSEEDRRALSIQVRTRVATVPLGVNTTQFRPAPAIKDRTGLKLLFVGAMRSWPNRDGAKWFVTRILPVVLQSQQAARLHLVGSGAEQLNLIRKELVVQGFCEDLAEQYRSCDVFVCPLRVGTGVKNKVLEAMACGCAIVTTTIGIEGLDVSHGIHVLVADDPQGFAEAILLLQDADLRLRLGLEARRFAEKKLSLEVVKCDLEQALNPSSLLSSPQSFKAASLGHSDIK